MILVVGSTGRLGREIVLDLLKGGEKVRAFVRHPSKERAHTLAEAGAELAYGDLRNTDSIVEACEGADVIVTCASAMGSQNPSDTFESVDRDGQLALASIAERTNCTRFVFVSYPHQPEKSSLGAAKLDVENHLASGRLPFTILRPTFFMETWLTPLLGFDYVEGRVRIYGSGTNPISWVSVSDVARMAAWSTRREPQVNDTIDFGGPQPLSPIEVVEIFERLSGRAFDRESVSDEKLEKQYKNALDPRLRAFSAIACQYARGYQPNFAALPKGTPHPVVTVEEYARKALRR